MFELNINGDHFLELKLKQLPIKNIILTIFEGKEAGRSFTYMYLLLNELFPVISSPS